MAEFSASEAAVEGFQLIRRRPATVAVWGLVYLLVFGVVGLVAFGTIGPLLNGESADSVENLGTRLIVAVVVAVLLALPIFTALSTALYRAVLFPEQGRFAYLRLGADEVRFLLLMLLFGVLWVGAAGLAVAVGALLGRALPGGVGALVVVLYTLAVIAGSVWLMVRLSLVFPMALAERAVRIGPAWRMTQGRFWPLLGAYVLAFIFSILVGVVGIVILAIMPGEAGGGMRQLIDAQAFELNGSTPEALVGLGLYLVVEVVRQLVQTILQFAPGASAYRQLAPPPQSQVDVFA